MTSGIIKSHSSHCCRSSNGLMTAGRCSQGGDVCILEKATVPSSDLEISYTHPRGIVAPSC